METIIIQAIAFQFIFLLIYEFLLKRDTFFNWNRAYLLGTSVCSLVLPFVKISAFSNVIPADYVVNLPTVFIGEQSVKQTIPVEQIETVLLHTTSVNYYVWFWSIGAILCACLLVYKLFRIGVFQYASTSIKERGYTIATLKNSEDAFSFLNTIFLGDQLKADQKESILKHEKVHVKDKHTLDLLWFELLRIIFWFNPLIYIYQKRITEVHEFIADKSASKYQENYYENLLAKTFNVAQFSLVNQFYSSSLIKKRIIMLTKKQSNSILKFKHALLAPVVVAMLVFTSCQHQTENKETILENIQNIKESIAEKGDMTLEEERALKSLLESTLNVDLGLKTTSQGNEISFKTLDQAPLFPDCDENATSEELKKCFSKSISKHVGQNFNTKLANDLNLTGRQKILVAFKIDKLGGIKDIKVRAEHDVLADEAKRVIEALPKLKPGKHNGQAVTVPYTLPIVFQVQ